MASEGISNVPKRVGFCFLMQLLIIGLGIVITLNMQSVGRVSNQNTSTVSAVIDDWNTVPFTEVRVTDDKCKSNEQSVFVREWAGIEQGCLVNKLDGYLSFSTNQVVMTMQEYDDYIDKQANRSGISTDNVREGARDRGKDAARRREPCNPIGMKGAKIQDEFYDMRFCGKTGGTAFIDSVRPYTDGKCPGGYVACSEATSKDNTICMKSSETENCPITFM